MPRVLCDGTTPRGICQQLGHNRKTCRYYESWFDWDNPAHDAFQEVFRRSLRRRWPLRRPLDDFSTCVRVRLYHQMGLKPRYLTSTFFAKITNSCSNLISIIPCSIANVSICLYPSLPVEWGAVVFLCRRAIPPINFQESHLQDPSDLLGAWTFTKT